MLSRNILYSRKPASTPKRSIQRERETEDDDDDDHDNDSNMKKTIKNALQPVKNVFSNSLARFAGFAFLVFIYVTLATTFYQQYEGWTITDSMFFVTQTLSTTGYGYPAPSSDGSKLFTIFFILIGISVVFAGIQDFLYANLGVLRNLFCKKYSSRQVAHDLESGDIYRHRKYLVRMIFGLALTVVLGAIVIKYNEDLTWTTAFYFIIETAATIGYGDVVLVKKSSRQFVIAFIIVCTTLVAMTIRMFSSTLKEDRQLDKLEATLRRLQALRFNKNIPVSSGDQVTKSDIILAMLCRTGTLNHANDISPWLEKLDAVAGNKTLLTQEELNVFLDREADAASTKLDHFMRAKSFSVWNTIREIFDLNQIQFGDGDRDHTHLSTENPGVELNTRNPTAQAPQRLRDESSDDGADSPLANNVDSFA